MNLCVLKKENDKFIIESNALTKTLVLKSKNKELPISKIDDKYEITLETMNSLCEEYENFIAIYYHNKP